MRVICRKQCDAWVPVSRGETPVAGKLAIWPGVAYEFPDGTEFAAHPPMQKDRRDRIPEKKVSADQAVKLGLVRVPKSEKVSG